MEAGADTQQSGETAVSESEAQQITLAQVSPLQFRSPVYDAFLER